MGCDIHIQIERRVNGEWQTVEWVDPFKREYYADKIKGGELDMPEDFDNRNYDLFGVLADVRNGTWGAPNQPIAQPRGLPDDMVNRAKHDAEDGYWLGDHSFSWLTLSELQAYPWDAPNHKRGWVSHDEAKKFRADGIPPTSYSAAGSHGEYIEWTETIRKAVGEWPDRILPILAMLGEPDDVRLVFGFDN